MSRKYYIYALTAISTLSLIIYLVIPLASRETKIYYNREMYDKKHEILDINRKHNNVNTPNIVIILADDLGKTDISLYDQAEITTPRIDSIGTNGVTFNQAYCTSPICSPSRAGLLTGRYQQRFGYEMQPMVRYPRNRLEYLYAKHVLDMGNWKIREMMRYPSKEDVENQGLPESEITIGEMLQSAGYNTGILGKWHLGLDEEFLPHNRGFNYHYGFYEAFSLYAPEETPDIVNYKHDYFANRHIWKMGRKDYCSLVKNGTVIEDNEYLTYTLAHETINFIEKSHDENKPFMVYVPFSAPHTPFQAPISHYEKLSHIKDENKRVYYAMILALDEAVGMILDKLEELHIDNNTLIFFASDNGGAVYTGATENAPLKGGKMTSFEGGLNIPFMMQWKGVIPRGKIYDKPVSLVDIFKTVSDETHCQLPNDRVYDGVNLIPYIQNKKDGSPHETLFWRCDYSKTVLKDGWKLIIDEKRNRFFLYDLKTDHEEKNNIAFKHADIVRELMKELRAWEDGLADPLWPNVIEYRHEEDGHEYFFAI